MIFAGLIYPLTTETTSDIWMNAVRTVFFLAEIDSSTKIPVTKITAVEIVVEAFGFDANVFKKLR